MSLVYRAEKLIDLACSTTHHEEARTAALAACQLIRKHGMRLSVDSAHELGGGRRTRAHSSDRAAWSARPEPAREKPPNGGTFSRTPRATRCGSCGDAIAAGDVIYVAAGVTWCGNH